VGHAVFASVELLVDGLVSDVLVEESDFSDDDDDDDEFDELSDLVSDDLVAELFDRLSVL
jgi:hypothetical protein